MHSYFYFSLNVSVPPDDSLMCAPEFTKPLKDLTVNDGDMLTLSCTIKGDPDPRCIWTKDGKVRVSFKSFYKFLKSEFGI